MKKIKAEIIINKPAQAVFAVITDFDTYHEWNRFTPRISLRTADFRVGEEFDLDCRMTKKSLLKNEHEVILEIKPEEYSFCMGTSRTRGRPGITSYRWQICRPMEGGKTQFVNFEEFHGPLAPVVYLLYTGKLRAAFADYCSSLKIRTESVASDKARFS
jgi:uncharacterized protein YndB with AHSA1/START domain